MEKADSQVVPPHVAEAIVAAGRRMDKHGWVPATAGNISVRLDENSIAITRSGEHKAHLSTRSVMAVDLLGISLTPGARPSAETGLHCQIYREDPKAGAVVHGHSVALTVLTLTDPGRAITFANYEVLKVFEGITSHDISLEFPIFENDQDILRLAARLTPLLRAGMPLGYGIRGHGVYAWGPDMSAALARLEGLEFLLACELERRKLGANR
jgi:methylthioribulose-1-phosphate dehydratase